MVPVSQQQCGLRRGELEGLPQGPESIGTMSFPSSFKIHQDIKNNQSQDAQKQKILCKTIKRNGENTKRGEKRISQCLGCLPRSAIFNVVSLTSLQRTCCNLEELGLLTHFRSAQNRCSGWLDYFSYHALDLLGNSLCYTRLIPGVHHFALQDLFEVEDRRIFVRIVIWELPGPEYMKGDLVF